VSRRSEADRVGFLRHQPQDLVTIVSGVLRNGGWVNVQADPEEIDPRAVRKPSIFSARGRPAPLATLVVSTGKAPHQIGFEHGSGRDAVARLRDAGIRFPAGTEVVADHPRRGLVLAVPSAAPAGELADLLLQASSQLTTVPLGDKWVADIYRP
jgi:hypothetical protein